MDGGARTKIKKGGINMDIKQAIAILKQERDFWDYSLPDDMNKRPPAVLRSDLVAAMDVAINCMEKEE